MILDCGNVCGEILKNLLKLVPITVWIWFSKLFEMNLHDQRIRYANSVMCISFQKNLYNQKIRWGNRIMCSFDKLNILKVNDFFRIPKVMKSKAVTSFIDKIVAVHSSS